MNRFNPLQPDVLQNPYPHYAWYREHEPVHWGMPGDPGTPGTWYLFLHKDVAPALKDPRLGREIRAVLQREKPEAVQPIVPEFVPLQQMMDRWMFLRDPPTHTRLRGLVNKAFVPRVVEPLFPSIVAGADQLIDAVIDSGHMDLIADFAKLLPVFAIAELLGVPAEDHQLFLPWSNALATTIEFKQTDEVRRNGTQAMNAMMAYLRDLIAERRKQPREDLVTGLIRAEDGGHALSEDEVLATITLLLSAGNDPTQHMIGNAVLTLLQHPQQLELLISQFELLDSANDELLRFDSSVQATFRYALEDVEIGGKQIRMGDHVALVFGSALRDPAYCAQPDELNLTRTNNRLPFGFGPHFCLGMPLARPMGRIALERLLRRLPHLKLQIPPNEVAWEERVAVRGVMTLPVSFGLN